MNNKNVIVSAFMANITSQQCLETNDNIKKYTEYCIPLLESNIHKIIFIDSTVVDKYKCYENENTQIISFVKESNYLYEHIDKITNYTGNFINPDKNTIEYMFTMCHKTEWVKKAIELTDGSFDQYIWVDFGVKHMCKCSNEEFIQKINRFSECNYDKVRIASIWTIDSDFNIDLFIYTCWYLAGSVFGGNKESLIEFARLMKEKCLEIITTKQNIIWEVNIWYMLYHSFGSLFSPYKCDHNITILDNY